MLNCNGSSGDGRATVNFQWDLRLGNEEVKKLFNKEEVSKEVNVTLVGQEGKTLWPTSTGGLRVIRSQYGSSISVRHTHLKNSESRGDGGMTSFNFSNSEEDTYVCSWAGLDRGNERDIFRGGFIRGGSDLLHAGSNQNMKLNLAVGLCQELESKEIKQATCNLKVSIKKLKKNSKLSIF